MGEVIFSSKDAGALHETLELGTAIGALTIRGVSDVEAVHSRLGALNSTDTPNPNSLQAAPGLSPCEVMYLSFAERMPAQTPEDRARIARRGTQG